MLEALDPGFHFTGEAVRRVVDLDRRGPGASGRRRKTCARYLDRLLEARSCGRCTGHDRQRGSARAVGRCLVLRNASAAGLEGSGAANEAGGAPRLPWPSNASREPSDELRQLCLEFAEGARQRRTAGAWAGHGGGPGADGHLSPSGCGGPRSPAPPQAIAGRGRCRAQAGGGRVPAPRKRRA